MNMQALMAQAQRMQNDIQKKKEEINRTVFNGRSEFIELEMYGTYKLKSIKFNDKINLNEVDIEMVEDMIVIAHNKCIEEIEKETEKKLGSYANKLSGLM